MNELTTSQLLEQWVISKAKEAKFFEKGWYKIHYKQCGITNNIAMILKERAKG